MRSMECAVNLSTVILCKLRKLLVARSIDGSRSIDWCANDRTTSTVRSGHSIDRAQLLYYKNWEPIKFCFGEDFVHLCVMLKKLLLLPRLIIYCMNWTDIQLYQIVHFSTTFRNDYWLSRLKTERKCSSAIAMLYKSLSN